MATTNEMKKLVLAVQSYSVKPSTREDWNRVPALKVIDCSIAKSTVRRVRGASGRSIRGGISRRSFDQRPASLNPQLSDFGCICPRDVKLQTRGAGGHAE